MLLDVNNLFKDLLEHDQKCSDTLTNFIFTSETEVFGAGHQFYHLVFEGFDSLCCFFEPFSSSISDGNHFWSCSKYYRS